MDASKNIYLHKFFKALADSIIKVFIPLYILKATGNISLSFAFLITQGLFIMLFMMLLKKVLRNSPVLCIIIHGVPLILTQALLSFCDINIWTVLSCSALSGLAQTLYSVPYNVVFTYCDKKTSVSNYQIATNCGSLVFTLLSGLALAKIQNSFVYLSITAAAIYIASAIPIFLARTALNANKHIEPEIRPKARKTLILFNFFHVGFGCFQIVIDYLIPLCLYANNLSFEAVTIVIALVKVVRIMVIYLVKHLKLNKTYIIIMTASLVLFIASCIMVLTIKNNVLLYILSCLIEITFPLFFIPLYALFCRYIKAELFVFEATFERDMYIYSCRPFAFATFFIGPSFISCIVTGILFTIMMYSSSFSLCLQHKNQ